VILGSGTSDLSYPGSAAAELAQVPFIELNAPADGITNRGFKFLLRTGPTTSMIAALAVETLATRFQDRKIGLLFSTGATTGAIAGSVIAGLKASKLQVLLAIGYPEDVTDLVDPAGRLMRAGVEIVLHAAGPLDALAFYVAMQAQNWRPKTVLGCGDGYLLRENAEALGPAFDDTLAIGVPFYPPQAAGIASDYLSRFGTAPRAPDSLSAYVGAKLVFDTLNLNGGDPARLLGALRRTSLPAGGLSNGWGVAFDRNGQNLAAFVTLQRWKSGKLIPEK
jgi:branched-chain amino acid transport system substrate-binding protein